MVISLIGSTGVWQDWLQETYSEHLDRLEVELRRELDTILEQEEVFCCQKSLVNWLKEGKRRTKFFHTWIIIR